jgi:hypothetical protein
VIVSPSTLHALLHLTLIEISVFVLDAKAIIAELLLLDLLVLVIDFL